MAARIAACLLNVSEARNYKLVRGIAEAALKDQEHWVPYVSHANATLGQFPTNPHAFKSKATVLNIFADIEYNRSVITIASPIEFLEQSLFQACSEAFSKVDLSKQHGGHPRLGVVDLIPIHPLSDSVSLEDCGMIARSIGNRMVKEFPGASAFFFGAADFPLQRNIVQRRKEVNWYAGAHGRNMGDYKWDIGDKPSSRYGITGIGAMPYMTNFNITIDTDNLFVGNTIAKYIRESSPTGLKGVQSMAFSHDGRVEIACNVETLDLQQKVF